VEEGGAGDQGIGARGGAAGGGGAVDAAIDLDAVAEVVVEAVLVGLVDLAENFLAEGLAAEARLDGHAKEQVDMREEGEGAGERRVRVEGEPAAQAMLADGVERLSDGVEGFHMDDDLVGPGLGKGLPIVVGASEHEVDIEEEVPVEGPEGGHGLGSEAKVRDEVAIHDVEVDPARAGGADALEAAGEIVVVSPEDGGGANEGMRGDGHGYGGNRSGVGGWWW